MVKRLGCVLALALPACGSGSSSAPATPTTPTPSPGSLAVNPSSVTYYPGFNSSTILVVNARSQTVTTSVADPRLAAATVSGSGASQAIAVQSFASGSTVLTIADGTSTASVPITSQPCLPPAPAFALASPAPNASGVPANVGSVVVGIVGSAGANSVAIASGAQLRLIPTGGAVVAGGTLTTQTNPPAGVTGSATYAGYGSASLPPLATTTGYAVQVVLPALPCLPPMMAGSFTTQ